MILCFCRPKRASEILTVAEGFWQRAFSRHDFLVFAKIWTLRQFLLIGRKMVFKILNCNTHMKIEEFGRRCTCCDRISTMCKNPQLYYVDSPSPMFSERFCKPHRKGHKAPSLMRNFVIRSRKDTWARVWWRLLQFVPRSARGAIIDEEFRNSVVLTGGGEYGAACLIQEFRKYVLWTKNWKKRASESPKEPLVDFGPKLWFWVLKTSCFK